MIKVLAPVFHKTNLEKRKKRQAKIDHSRGNVDKYSLEFDNQLVEKYIELYKPVNYSSDTCKLLLQEFQRELSLYYRVPTLRGIITRCSTSAIDNYTSALICMYLKNLGGAQQKLKIQAIFDCFGLHLGMRCNFTLPDRKMDIRWIEISFCSPERVFLTTKSITKSGNLKTVVVECDMTYIAWWVKQLPKAKPLSRIEACNPLREYIMAFQSEAVKPSYGLFRHRSLDSRSSRNIL